MKKSKVIAIVGPTASGKTSLSIKLAQQFDGEVISADSRQVYTGMDLGTGKVTQEEMEGVPHYLLDVVDPMTVYTSADFKRDADAALKTVLEKEKLPVVAGGSFFYLELLRGTMQAAPVEPNYKFREELEQYSDTELLEQLRIKDSKRAENIDPNNRRRLIRSLEIIEALGEVPEIIETESEYDWLVLGVDIPQETLHENIKIRLHERFDEGMIAEVEKLHAEGMTFERMGELGLEYRYIAKYLQGELELDDMKEQLEIKIRQFAKRQMTWLKRDEAIHWVEPKDLEKIFQITQDFLDS